MLGKGVAAQLVASLGIWLSACLPEPPTFPTPPSRRAPQSGPAHFALAWRYEPLVRLDALAYRTVRFAQSVEALPSLHLTARLATGLPGCVPGGCLLQAQLRNLAADALAVTGLTCPSSSWQLCEHSSGDSSLQIAPDVSAALHRQLVPVGTAGIADGASSSLSVPEASLLEASRRAAAAGAASPKHLQPAAAAAQQQRRHRQQQQQGGGIDVVVLWQAGGKDSTAPRHGFTCTHNQRWVGIVRLWQNWLGDCRMAVSQRQRVKPDTPVPPSPASCPAGCTRRRPSMHSCAALPA